SSLLRPPPCSTLFPYTTLFRSIKSPCVSVAMRFLQKSLRQGHSGFPPLWLVLFLLMGTLLFYFLGQVAYAQSGSPLAYIYRGAEDRKSTRLNSSHVKSSYAVFC